MVLIKRKFSRVVSVAVVVVVVAGIGICVGNIKKLVSWILNYLLAYRTCTRMNKIRANKTVLQTQIAKIANNNYTCTCLTVQYCIDYNNNNKYLE